MSTEKPPTGTWPALKGLLVALLRFLVALLPIVLVGVGVVMFLRGQYEAMHELFVVALLISIGNQVLIVRETLERVERAQIEQERRAARENLSTLDLLRRTLETR